MDEYLPPGPPPTLFETGREFYLEFCAEHEPEDVTDLALLARAAHALDREAQARRKLRDDGLYLEDRFGRLYTHPAVQVEAKSRAAAAQIFNQLQRAGAQRDRLELQIEREIRMRSKQTAQQTPRRQGGGTRRHG